MPYDRLRELLVSFNTFRVNNCICRVQQDMEGTRRCNFPLDVELIFDRGEEMAAPPVPPFITKD